MLFNQLSFVSVCSFWVDGDKDKEKIPIGDESKKKAAEKLDGFFRFVEMEGVEPSSKQGTLRLSTCLFRCWFS